MSFAFSLFSHEEKFSLCPTPFFTVYCDFDKGHDLLDTVDEGDRIKLIDKDNLSDLVEVVKESEGQAKDRVLHGSNYPWLVEFCKVNPLDSPFLSEIRIHLRKELAILEALYQIENCKSMATYAKRSGINSHLERLQNPPDTRWNGKCPMSALCPGFWKSR